MWIAIVGLAVLLLASVWITRVNARYERARGGGREDDADADAHDTGDARVASAWDDFGLAEDTAQVRASFDRLVETAPVTTLARKSSLVAMAVMAVRAERHDVLEAIAAR